MRLSTRTVGCLYLISLGPLFGQGPTLAGSGYADPSIIRVAPGQITTLFVTGLKAALSSQPVKAAGLPLPTSLAGISSTLNQPGKAPVAIPLLSVQQKSICSNSGNTPDCVITAITVQVPFDLLLPPQGASAELVVIENGNVSKAFRVQPVVDDLHILNRCDAFPSDGLPADTCNSVVAHGDGTLVTSESPAKPGETVVIYAFGFGQTTPAVRTGDATPTAAPTLGSRAVSARYDFRANAGPSQPNVVPGSPFSSPIVPDFVGLTPGQVGLYQINIKIPDIVMPVDPCSRSLGIQSNLTITFAGQSSFDGATMCVQPAQ